MADILPIKQIIEGAIMASEQPVNIDQLLQLFETDRPARADIRTALNEIERECASKGYELKTVASGYRFQVRADYGEWIGRLWKEKSPRYSRALLETLSLIAYKQPITRGDIESIRGVSVSTNIIRALLEREWVRIVGHRDVPGHPALYATTKIFLDYFNLSSLDELPSLAEIKDLTSSSEEFDLDEEPIIAPSLEVDAADLEQDKTIVGLDDEALDAVSQRVSEIQENVRNLFGDEPDAEEDIEDGSEEGNEEEAEEGNKEDSSISAADKTQKSATVTPINQAVSQSPEDPAPGSKATDPDQDGAS